ncbi:MAG TPA: GntR family transcriptional regulator [Halothiobacillus sp.]|nr:MAG: GntR family transcriptional regulator [Halothiobacillus sp. 20-54-6]HQT43849.1 GntR family transcriptional regulator [Halothiobacillus sp.]
MSAPLRFPAERRHTLALAERVYAELKRALFAFELLPGERFSENTIAERTGASRTPVREALTRLAREGFLTVQNRSGWRVNDLDFSIFDQLYEVRTIVELASIDRLTAQTEPAGIAELITLWQVNEAERLTDGPAVFVQDEQFHSRLVAGTGNAELQRIHTSVTERIRIVRQLDFTESYRVEATYNEHAAILTAIVQHRASEAKRLMQTHIELSRQSVRKISLHRLYEARQQARDDAHQPERLSEPATGGIRSPLTETLSEKNLGDRSHESS